MSERVKGSIHSPSFRFPIALRSRSLPDARGSKKIDIYAVGVYKKQGQKKVLVGHVPIEFSFLFYKFIEKDGNKIYAKIRGGRQLEIGLVVPAIYIVYGKNKRLTQIFLDEAQKRKSSKSAHMDVKLSEIDTYFYEEL